MLTEALPVGLLVRGVAAALYMLVRMVAEMPRPVRLVRTIGRGDRVGRLKQ